MKALAVSRRCRLLNPPKRCVVYKCHYDLGAIRTESAVRPALPEKKERQDRGDKKTPRKDPRRRIYLFVVLILGQPIYSQEFLNNEFASAN